MPDDYSPTVVSVGGNYKLESKAAAAWQDMQAAASRDGVSLWIISAYRTLERQTELYQEKVEEYKNLGYNEGDAKIEAGKWVAVPGTSEHCLGYAADLCSLEENFENSDQFAWVRASRSPSSWTWAREAGQRPRAMDWRTVGMLAGSMPSTAALTKSSA